MTSYIRGYFAGAPPPEEETPALLARSLTELRDDLAATPAHANCLADPKYMGDAFLALFLRTEDFNVPAAAARYRRYWEFRLKIFEDAAGLPFSAARERNALDLGYMKLVPGARDRQGRQVIMINVGALNKKTAGAVEMVRAMWYVLHAALEDPETGISGRVVVITSAKGFTLGEFSPEFDRMGLKGEKCLPMKFDGVYMVFVPSFFKSIWAVSKTLMSAEMNKKCKVYAGDAETVKEGLSNLIDPGSLPEEVGGPMKTDHKAWVQRRVDAGL